MPANTSLPRESPGVVTDTRRIRPRFFDGKFLTAADLMQEQNYLLTRQADLARTLGFGVVSGLRVAPSDLSASGLRDPAASLVITAGHGLTPAGEIVFLPSDLVVDLDQVAQLQRLNAAFGLARDPQPPFRNLAGLFVVGLRAVEFTANPTPSYPPSVDGGNALRDGEIIEATALTLVPYESEASLQNARAARTRAARDLFLKQKPPQLPAGVLPLALLYIANGQLAWVDEWLVRREAGDDDRFGFGFAPRALSEAHYYHYQDMLKSRPSAADGQLSAKQFLEIIPPCGPLPDNLINLADFTQGYFPAEARIELALVPEDEIPALMEDAIDLPPIDLGLRPEDQDALAILVLAPVPRADYGDTLATLSRLPRPTLRNPTPPLLSQQKPINALLRLNAAFELRRATQQGTATPPAPAGDQAEFVDPAWRDAFKKTTGLWYVRRRNLPSGHGLAGTPLAVRTPRDSDSPGTGARDPETGKREAALAVTLSKLEITPRYTYLRALADVQGHAALVDLLTHEALREQPELLPAVFSFIERELQLPTDDPRENLALLAEEEPGRRVLDAALLEKITSQLLTDRGLKELQGLSTGRIKLTPAKPILAPTPSPNPTKAEAEAAAKKEAAAAEAKKTADEAAARQREADALAARQKAEEEQRRQSETLAKQQAEQAARNREAELARQKAEADAAEAARRAAEADAARRAADAAEAKRLADIAAAKKAAEDAARPPIGITPTQPTITREPIKPILPNPSLRITPDIRINPSIINPKKPLR